ncbi:MAG: undecaprenyldiphospho-muramoylpentapeptide beta-N-acetylglucosaminyltransferase [Flavobacteriales bacterium AspAUS03]
MKKKSPKILICGGGTGGHVYSAIAIADALKKHLLEMDRPAKFLFIGAKDHMEMEKIPQAGYDIKGMWISAFPEKISKEAFVFLLKVINSYKESRKIIRSFCPDVVIGTGGYASGIPLCLARSYKIPVFVQEQNTRPGYTNIKVGGYCAKKVFVAFEEALVFFDKKKTIVTGNPIRSEFLSPLPSREEACQKFGLNLDRPIILSIGGSQGARSINNGWVKGIKRLIERDIQLLWQVGKSDFEKIRNNPGCQHPNIHFKEFINDMPMAYAAADVVVSRAGGLAISELAVLGKFCLLIPLPWASEDHQFRNANAVVNKKAAFMIQNEEIDEKLIDTVIRMLNNQAMRQTLSKNILTISMPNAAQTIAEEIINHL